MSGKTVQNNHFDGVSAGKLFVISAPSGAGKTSLIKAILPKITPYYRIEQVITYTTKQPRSTERNGLDYHFLEKDDFERRIQEGFFLEWSDAYGTYYGSPSSLVSGLKGGCSYIMIIDRIGSERIKQLIAGAILIYIEVPFRQLKKRLIDRATENEEQVDRRLKRAQVEIALEQFTPLYNYHVKNLHFDRACGQLFDIFCSHLNNIVQKN